MKCKVTIKLINCFIIPYQDWRIRDSLASNRYSYGSPGTRRSKQGNSAKVLSSVTNYPLKLLDPMIKKHKEKINRSVNEIETTITRLDEDINRYGGEGLTKQRRSRVVSNVLKQQFMFSEREYQKTDEEIKDSKNPYFLNFPKKNKSGSFSTESNPLLRHGKITMRQALELSGSQSERKIKRTNSNSVDVTTKKQQQLQQSHCPIIKRQSVGSKIFIRLPQVSKNQITYLKTNAY